MKKETLWFFLTVMSIFLVSFTTAESASMTVRANILADTISIEVPDSIFLGNVTSGFSTDYQKVDINNTGTTNVRITPRLENSSEEIFNYTYFARRTTEDFVKIGDFSLNISKPSSLGGKRSDYCYIKLDLTNYGSRINQNLLDYRTNVIFWATSY
jgi:hypothetical protein